MNVARDAGLYPRMGITTRIEELLASALAEVFEVFMRHTR